MNLYEKAIAVPYAGPVLAAAVARAGQVARAVTGTQTAEDILGGMYKLRSKLETAAENHASKAARADAKGDAIYTIAHDVFEESRKAAEQRHVATLAKLDEDLEAECAYAEKYDDLYFAHMAKRSELVDAAERLNKILA